MAGAGQESRGASHPRRPTLRRAHVLRDHGGEVLRPARDGRADPFTRDELYLVARGSGTFANGDRRHSFSAGDVLFVPAGVPHRFADFTDDFGTWVIFYGPEDGERPR